jgi:uncharacterized protein (TIGR02265 family)
MKIKGLIIQARIEFIKDYFGEEGWNKIRGSMSEQDRNILDGTIVAGIWYPFEFGEKLDRAIVEVLGNGDDRVFEEIGVKSAKRSLVKVHSSFIREGDPQAFMKKAGLIYRFYYDTGYREYEQTGANSGVMTTYDAETYSAVDCLTVIGWYREGLRMCGARNIRAYEDECRARGGSCCRYRFTWDM